MHRRIVAALVIGSVLVAQAVPAVAGDAIRIRVWTGFWCVLIHGPAETRHVLTVRASDGRMRARVTDRTDGAGHWYACLGADSDIVVNAGDRVEVAAGQRSTTLRVPDIWPRIDRDKDVIRGRGPRGDTLRVAVMENLDQPLAWTVEVGDDGRWRVDVRDRVDLLGGAPVRVVLRRGWHRVQANGYAPIVAFGPQSNVVSGTRTPGHPVTITLQRGDAEHAAPASATPLGTFTALLYDRRGQALYPRAGDIVAADLADGLSLRVPRWDLAGDAATDMVSGRCMADAPYRLWVRRRLMPDADRPGRTDGRGRFTIHVRGLQRDQPMRLDCEYPGGDVFLVEGLVR